MCRKSLLSRIRSPGLSSTGEKAHAKGPRKHERERMEVASQESHTLKERSDC